VPFTVCGVVFLMAALSLLDENEQWGLAYAATGFVLCLTGFIVEQGWRAV
jgi:uncharacterized membrane protein (UPF0136 family)